MSNKNKSGGGLHGCLVSLVWLMGLLLVLGIGGIYYVKNASYTEGTPEIQAGEGIISRTLGWLGNIVDDIGNKDPIVNILLIGQDQRPGEDHKLSDTMIIVSVNKKTKAVTLCSLMRDMYVQLPDYNGHSYGMNRINAAYSIGYVQGGREGAMAMLDQLMLDQFGVTIDHNVEIGFSAFQGIVDYLDGVDITLTSAEANYMTNHAELSGTYQEGVNHLNGLEALTYARMRHSSAADSDFYRTGRQRAVVSAVMDKCRNLKATELPGVIQELLPLVETDMSAGEALSLGMRLLPMLNHSEIQTQQIPAEGTYSNRMVEISGYPAAVLDPDLEKNREILMSICEAEQ